MEKEKFEKYLKERYYTQISWYDKKAAWNQKCYKRLQLGLITLSALTPVLIAINWGLKEYPQLQWISLIIAVLVAILAASLKTFKLQEDWLNYRAACETLKKEIYFYDLGLGDYSNVENKESVFVERVEKIIRQEVDSWLPRHKEAGIGLHL